MKLFSLHRWTWLLMTLLLVGVRAALTASEQWVEKWYSLGIFSYIRLLLDYTFGLLPFPLLYLFFPLALAWLIKGCRQAWRWRGSSLSGLLGAAKVLLNWLAALLVYFLLLWGFNYARLPLEQHLSIDPQPLTQAELEEELKLQTEAIKQLRTSIPSASDNAFTETALVHITEADMQHLVLKRLEQLNYPPFGSPRIRQLWPPGLLLRISTAGFYLPFTGECNVDSGLHPLQKPFVMAHELFHAHGFTDEGSCNFLAYISCQAADDPFIRYAGALNYWRYLAGSYRRAEPEAYQTFRIQLPKGILADLDAINQQMQRYPDVFPRFRDLAYDTYLKAQGIEEGMKNYSRIIMLARAWRLHQEGL